jgi:RNA polymerase sigma factor (sigma-70 family)
MNAAAPRLLLPRVRAMLADRPADRASDAELLQEFVATRDERAFATLVRRHGPLVLAAARRGTGNPADADDVFQATFLLLARNAARIRNRAAVAGWLHGVASRMARTARRAAARRRAHEANAPPPAPVAHCDLSWREVQTLFEDELARLPDRYRVPFVLCALNGEPRADVARRLGVKEGTISSRLAEAKRRLQAGLGARGVSLAAVLGTITLPGLAISRELMDRTVHSAATGSAPAAVSALLRGSSAAARNLLFALALTLSAGVFLAAAGAPPAPPVGKQAPVKEAPNPPAAPQKVAVSGKVVDADGKPVANAPVRLWSFRTGDQAPEPVTRTDAAGAFRFDASPQDLTDGARVVVTPPNHPAQWLPLAKFTGEQTLRLPPDDVPFTGRVASLENQPLRGVTVEVVRVGTVADGDLTGWLEKNVAMRKERYWLNEGGLVMVPGGLVLSPGKTTTDADGKFRLTGFGRDRVLTVKVYGPNVETKFFWVVSRTGGPDGGYIKTPDFNHGVYNPDVTVLLGPSRPLVGTVRDSKTGKPVPGVIVSEVNDIVPKAVTDANGRYRLEGVPKKKQYGLNVSGRKGVPYFDHTHMWVADVAGLDPLETDLTITRGLELTGRVVDKAGRPARAEVFYSPSGDNPNGKDDPARVISSDGYRTKPDGTFYLTVWPGKGVLDVRADDAGRYATVDVEKLLREMKIRSRPVSAVNALIPIDADAARPESLTVTIRLEDGTAQKGTVVGPDGKPLAGVMAAGVRPDPPRPLDAAEFSISGMGPTSRRMLLFLHEGKKLGAVQPVTGTGTEPLTVKLRPLGSAAGQVQRPGKESRAGLAVTALPRLAAAEKYENLPYETLKSQGVFGMVRAPWWKLTKRTAKTDADGQFRLDGLMPGLEYTLYVSDGDLGEPGTLVTSRSKVTVEPGKTTDLGVLQRAEKSKE